MGNTGLENKIAVQRKELRSDVKRAACVKPGEVEMIELVEEDSLDLMEIVKSSNITKVPPDLQLLWDHKTSLEALRLWTICIT